MRVGSRPSVSPAAAHDGVAIVVHGCRSWSRWHSFGGGHQNSWPWRRENAVKQLLGEFRQHTQKLQVNLAVDGVATVFC